ncbi:MULTISPECIES: tRNA-binding protein [Halococcus]|uniref:Protein secretion chaperonin CsaA n=1 Tax=Halococcus salifodinae DSM 8989 TaxID=1227456 RepID=M0MU68_9EURY|nr:MULTISPECIES: tRNA-binding protein [Halococcus]EMA49161.1 protein secretion chaperonin CsaA [Halococcus salifodinae DSM 8989]
MGIDEPDIDSAAFLDDVEMRVGEIVAVDEFPEARKDVYKLDVDFGGETLQSAAGLTRYEQDELLGRQVIAVVNLGTVSIAGFESQCLVTGVDAADGDGVVHLQPEGEVENGARVY